MAKSKSKIVSLPKQLDKLIRFFDMHDLGEFWEKMPESHFEIHLKKRRHLVEIDEKLVKKLSSIAKSKHVSFKSLIHSWLKDKIAHAA